MSEAELVEAIGAARRTVRHHLGQLEAAAMVSSASVEGATLYCLPNAGDNVLERYTRENGRLAVIQESIRAGIPRPEITRLLVAKFGIGPRAARKDVQRYLRLCPHGGSGQARPWTPRPRSASTDREDTRA